MFQIIVNGSSSNVLSPNDSFPNDSFQNDTNQMINHKWLISQAINHT